MESPLSQDSIHILVEGSRYWIWPKKGYRAGRVGLPSHVLPPTLEGHNFFVRNLIWVFMDSIEIPLSQNFICMPVEGSGYWRWPKRGDRSGRVGLPSYV